MATQEIWIGWHWIKAAGVLICAETAVAAKTTAAVSLEKNIFACGEKKVGWLLLFKSGLEVSLVDVVWSCKDCVEFVERL